MHSAEIVFALTCVVFWVIGPLWLAKVLWSQFLHHEAVIAVVIGVFPLILAALALWG